MRIISPGISPTSDIDQYFPEATRSTISSPAVLPTIMVVSSETNRSFHFSFTGELRKIMIDVLHGNNFLHVMSFLWIAGTSQRNGRPELADGANEAY
jgi:hypothetical protein